MAGGDGDDAGARWQDVSWWDRGVGRDSCCVASEDCRLIVGGGFGPGYGMRPRDVASIRPQLK